MADAKLASDGAIAGVRVGTKPISHELGLVIVGQVTAMDVEAVN
jgi:hypothetical protein